MPTFTHNPKEIEDDMAGVKRNYDGVKKEGGHEAPEAVAGASKEKQKSNRPYVKNDVKKGYESDGPVSPFMGMFETFRDELDEHHDRRERIIKASRDITAASKKIIFALQRIRTLNTEVPPKIDQETKERYAVISKNFEAIAPDLAGINAWRYQRQISGGIQEYMEAISFAHYLRHQTLISISESSSGLPAGIELTGDDYVLGLFDLVGELMRFAITTMATTGSLPGLSGDEEVASGAGGGRDILQDLRILRTSFQALDTSSCGGTGLGKDIQKKMEVMITCVEKVETAVYGMIIRGRERPKGWVPDADDRGAAVESY